jgi:hypothetical protein
MLLKLAIFPPCLKLSHPPFSCLCRVTVTSKHIQPLPLLALGACWCLSDISSLCMEVPTPQCCSITTSSILTLPLPPIHQSEAEDDLYSLPALIVNSITLHPSDHF